MSCDNEKKRDYEVTISKSEKEKLLFSDKVKTINGESIIGEGDIEVGGGTSPWEQGSGESSAQQKGTYSIAEGECSVAEGYNTLSKSDYSHTEGWATRTIIDTTDPDTYGHASHAEGSHTIAKGTSSHAEGNTTESNGWYSHAEGAGSLSGGIASHAEGNGTVTNNLAEHSEGSFNKSTPSTDSESNDGTLHSIGIGTSITDRKNAFEVMQNGDTYLLGLGEYDGTNTSEANTLQDTINSKQEELVSSENIKTVNGESILGSGNIDIGGKVQSVNEIEPDENGNITINAEDISNALTTTPQELTDEQKQIVWSNLGLEWADNMEF